MSCKKLFEIDKTFKNVNRHIIAASPLVEKKGDYMYKRRLDGYKGRLRGQKMEITWNMEIR